MSVVVAIAAVGTLMFGLTSFLVLARRRFHVFEDPRIDVVEEMLPHANCGACGFPGCRPFAEALVQRRVAPSGCTVGPAAQHERIASYLGVEVGVQEKRVARLACAGGTHVARQRAHYAGLQSCAAASLVSGGGKGCFFGCLGFGDCAEVCSFDAIQMNSHSLPVVSEDACTACGDCVEACPKDLFSIHPISHRLFVACASHAAGDAVLADCEVGCTACGRCAIDAPDQIVMDAGLPRIDYAVPALARHAIERCPTGAIGWFREDGSYAVGEAAKKVVRQSPLPASST